jgi:hypothetical protein
MSEETPESLIPYDEIVQEALRDVVGRVLREVEQSGRATARRPSFYITFKTKMPGVSIPKALARTLPGRNDHRHQHRFRGPEGRGHEFSVGLSIGGVPSTLVFRSLRLPDFVGPGGGFSSLKFQANERLTLPRSMK